VKTVDIIALIYLQKYTTCRSNTYGTKV